MAWAIKGGTVCVYHGGSAPQVRAAARKRLESLAPLALEVLSDLAMGTAIDPETGVPIPVPPAVRQRAADSILRNSGIAAPTELDVAVTQAPRPDLDAAIAAALERRNQG